MKHIGRESNPRNVIIKNTGFLAFSRTLSSILPAVSIILIGRALGSQGVGMIYGILALVLLFYQFSDFGYSQIVVREISRNPEKADEVLQKGFGFIVVVSLFFLVLLYFSGFLIKKFPPMIVFILGSSFIIFRSILRLWVSAFQGIDKLEMWAFMEVVDNGVRFLGILILFLTGRLTVLSVSLTYLLSSAVATCVITYKAFKQFGFVRFKPMFLSRKELIESSHFSLNFLGTTIFFQVNKILLARFSSISSVGIYSYAEKVFSIFINLLGAFQTTTYSWFFRYGKNVKKEKFVTFSFKIVLLVLIYGVLSGILVFLTAPLIVKLVGSGFKESILALRILSPYPLLRGIAIVLGDMMTGKDYQKDRMIITWIGAIINILLNLVLIILYGWLGAAIATMVSYVIIIVIEVFFLRRKGLLYKQIQGRDE